MRRPGPRFGSPRRCASGSASARFRWSHTFAMFLAFVHRCSRSQLWTTGLVLFQVLVHVVIMRLVSAIVEREARTVTRTIDFWIPDGSFGYAPEDLHHLYKQYGPVARLNYVWVELFDYFPYIVTYVLLGACLVDLALTKSGLRARFGKLVVVPVLMGTMDAIENACNIYTDVTYVEGGMSQAWIAVAQVGAVVTRAKYVLLAVTMIVIVLAGILAFAKTAIRPSAKATKHQ